MTQVLHLNHHQNPRRDSHNLAKSVIQVTEVTKIHSATAAAATTLQFMRCIHPTSATTVTTLKITLNVPLTMAATLTTLEMTHYMTSEEITRLRANKNKNKTTKEKQATEDSWIHPTAAATVTTLKIHRYMSITVTAKTEKKYRENYKRVKRLLN